MRPFKHVARQSGANDFPRYQNIIGIDLARFPARWGEVPVVATAEVDRITLYAWDDRVPAWTPFELAHEPLAFDGTGVESPTAWNSSDRVAIACSSSTVHVLYKRQIATHTSLETAIFLDRFQPEDAAPESGNHRLRKIDSRKLVEEQAGRQQIGRSLWATFDERTRRLLVLCQIRPGSTLFRPDPHWELHLITVAFDAFGNPMDTDTLIARGGFDLDARLAEGRILAVHRRTAEAFRVPMALLAGGLHLTSGADADSFCEPILLTRIDLQTLHSSEEAIPGGEHPQIQRVDPLLITMDRPSQLDLALDTPILPLPPRRPHAIWRDGRTDKIAFLSDGTEAFRGVILTSDDRVIPRSHAAMSAVTHLLEDRNGLLVHAEPFRRFPVQVLSAARDRKGIAIDVLHHRDVLGLYRTRLHATLSDGALTVTDRAFEVWDVAHAQVGPPDDLNPSADGETLQFEPFEDLTLTASPDAVARPARADITMGGHLAADLSREPIGFLAYSDLGDGGLRVIFANDIPPLSDPPPIGDEKTLRPEQVTGPHLPCDEWIEIPAADFVDSGLPSYRVGIGFTERSLGSSFEVPIEFLLDACVILTGSGAGPGGSPLDPLAGLSRPQLDSVDAFRLSTAPPLVLTMTASDGRAVTVDVVPGGFIASQSVTLSATVGGTSPVVLWTLTSLDANPGLPAGPVALDPARFALLTQLGGLGNPLAAMFLPFAGAWRLSVFLTDGSISPPAGSIDIVIVASTFDLLTELPRSLEGDFYRIGNLNLSILQHDIAYEVDDSGRVLLVKIAIATRRRTEVRFRANGAAQGVVDSRSVLSFSTDQLKLNHGLDLLFQIPTFRLNLRYGRAFTPGMLMRDTRHRNVIDGSLLGGNPVDTVPRRAPFRHAGIGAKPLGSAAITKHELTVDVTLTPFAYVASALIVGLTLLGLLTLAQLVVDLVGAISAAAVLGVAGPILVIVLTIALTFWIAANVPPAVEGMIRSQIEQRFASGSILETLNRLPLARYMGEGAAEAIARKVLEQAQQPGFTGAPAPADPAVDSAGFDRLHGQVFQTVFASEGVCRILVRYEECAGGVHVPRPPSGPGDDDDRPPIVVGRWSVEAARARSHDPETRNLAQRNSATANRAGDGALKSP